MARLRAVVEIEPWAEEHTPWPIENAEPYRWEPLDGSTPPATIGTTMARLARWCQPEDVEADHEPTAAEALRWIATADHLVISAGIQAADAETTVNPGCCADLEGRLKEPDRFATRPSTPGRPAGSVRSCHSDCAKSTRSRAATTTASASCSSSLSRRRRFLQVLQLCARHAIEVFDLAESKTILQKVHVVPAITALLSPPSTPSDPLRRRRTWAAGPAGTPGFSR